VYLESCLKHHITTIWDFVESGERNIT